MLLWIWRPDLLGGTPKAISDQIRQVVPNPTQNGLTGGRALTQRPMSDFYLQLLAGSVAHRLPANARIQLRQGYNKIGRQPRNEDQVYLIALPHDAAISRDHAYIIFDQAQAAFIWENRENSVWINDEFLSAADSRRLQEGDRIRVGNTLLEFARYTPVAPFPRAAAPDAQTMNPYTGSPVTQPVAEGGPNGLLRIVKGARQGEQFVLSPHQGRIQVGRTEENHWALHDPKVSRRHAQFYFDGSRWNVFDMDSRWGLQINGQKLKNYALRHSDLITLGDTVIRYEQVGQAPPTVR